MINKRHAPIVSLVVVLVLVVLSSDAAGQSTGPIPRLSGESPLPALVGPVFADLQRRSLTLEALTVKGQPAQQARASRDTLKNGAIIGAVVGTAALAALGAFYCHLYQEENGPSCRSATLRAAAIGAAIGTGTGLVFDAAFDRHAGAAVRIRVRF